MEKIYKNNSLSDQGITTKEELKKRLVSIFEEADSQSSALIEIYRLIFPDWDDIEDLDGFPEVGQEMWKYICNLFIQFDKLKHPGVFNGGMWLNNGFSSSDRLGPWEINLKECKANYSAIIK